jgi:hypothetical protein
LKLPLSAALTAVVETPLRVAAKTDRQTNEAILFQVATCEWDDTDRLREW